MIDVDEHLRREIGRAFLVGRELPRVDQSLRPFCARFLDLCAHRLRRGCAHHGTEGRRSVQGIGELVLPGKLDEAFDEGLEHLSVHVNPFDAAAGLAGVEVRAVHEIFDGRRERGVGPDVGRVLAAQFQPRCHEAPACGPLHRMAAGHRAGECDEADAGIGNQARHLIVIHVQKLEHALRQSGCVKRLGVTLGHQRRLRRHFEDDRVAGKKRRYYGVHRCEPGVVPRRDDQDHPERIAADESPEPDFRTGVHIGERAFGDARHVRDPLLEAAADFHGGMGDGAPHLAGEFFTQLLCSIDAPGRHAKA